MDQVKPKVCISANFAAPCPAAYHPKMGTLRDKLLKWLDKHFPPEKHGSTSELARALGKDQSAVSRWRAARARGKAHHLHLSLENLESLAIHQDMKLWQLLREVDSGRTERQALPAVPINQKQQKALAELLGRNPRQARRLLLNLQHQEALGYTALVSDVVRTIIDHGPERAAGRVAALLSSYTEESSPQRTRLRKKLATEYEDSQ